MIQRFITFEGGDGTGKTEQMARFANKLKRQKKEVHLTREPGGTALGETLRALFLQEEPLDAHIELLLLLTARYDHVQRVIHPLLAKGAWVLCDRFIHSTLAYQGLLGGISQEKILDLHRMFQIDLTPWITFILEADPQISQSRCQNRASPNHYDLKEAAFHEAVHHSYQRLDWGNIVRVPSACLEEMEAFIWDTFCTRAP